MLYFLICSLIIQDSSEDLNKAILTIEIINKDLNEASGDVQSEMWFKYVL